MTATLERKRNICLDLAKVLAACAVVCIHIKFPGWFGQAVDAVARFAVPFFFMVSGYFACYDKEDKLKKKLIHILKIYVLSAALYFVYGFARALVYDVQFAMTQYLGKYADARFWLSWLFLNNSRTPGHLWFLPALVYTYGIQMLLLKCRWGYKRCSILGIGLLCVQFMSGDILSVFGILIPHIWLRNFFLTGYPCFVVGMMIKKHEGNMDKQKSLLPIAGITLIGVAESCLSRYFFCRKEMYIGSVLIAVALLALCIKYRDKSYGKVLSVISKTSLSVYILHFIVDEVLSLFLQKVGFPYTAEAWRWIQPIAVCAVSVLAGVLIPVLFSICRQYAKGRKINEI